MPFRCNTHSVLSAHSGPLSLFYIYFITKKESIGGTTLGAECIKDGPALNHCSSAKLPKEDLSGLRPGGNAARE